jgi:hypothetical protein
LISTVTTSTVTTVTTALAGSVALVGILILFGLLVQKEVTTASSENRLRKLGKALNIAIIPLLIAFLLMVIFRVAEVLK